MAESADTDAIRFADVLTTASAAANYLGESAVRPLHLKQAIGILTGALRLEDLGRPVSPLVPRTLPGAGSSVQPAVRELAQRWFASLGSDYAALLSDENLQRLRMEVDALLAAGETTHP